MFSVRKEPTEESALVSLAFLHSWPCFQYNGGGHARKSAPRPLVTVAFKNRDTFSPHRRRFPRLCDDDALHPHPGHRRHVPGCATFVRSRAEKRQRSEHDCKAAVKRASCECVRPERARPGPVCVL